MLGYETNGNPGIIIAQHGERDSGKTNWKITSWEGAWQVKAQFFYPFLTNRFLRIYIGWKSVGGLSKMMFANHIHPFRKYHK